MIFSQADQTVSAKHFTNSFIILITLENFCGPPPQLEYGQLKEEYLDMTTFPKGAEIKYICRPGYVRIPLRNSVARCLADTTWSRPEIFCARKLYCIVF